jgi:hypothetical protein
MTAVARISGLERKLIGLADDPPTAVRIAPDPMALSRVVIEGRPDAIAHEA